MKVKWFLYPLLLAVPATVVAWYLNRTSDFGGQLTSWIFGFALISLIPLAALLGSLTDTLETYFGARIGGLLGASFGNVPELAIGVALLVHAHRHLGNARIVDGDLTIIRALLIGSVINNVLFVLGSSIFSGAVRNGRMRFSKESASGYASMLVLSVVGLALPTIATSVTEGGKEELASAEVNVTIAFAVVLILSYIAYIAATVFKVGARARPGAEISEGEHEAHLQGGHAHSAHAPKAVKTEEEDKEDDEAARRQRRALRAAQPYAVPIALVSLTLTTLATVLVAGLLVSVTDTVVLESDQLTPLSVGLILFPIVCNLGEQAGSINNAWRNKMEGAMALAAGSSIQVALFVTPVLALISLVLAGGQQELILRLIFLPFALIVIGLVSFMYALVSLDGETTWLEGLELLSIYAMIAVAAFVLPGT